MLRLISPADLRLLYDGLEEFAVVDPREKMLFARGHLFAATNLPLSRLEPLVGDCIPVQATLTVMCDDDDDLTSLVDYRNTGAAFALRDADGIRCANMTARQPRERDLVVSDDISPGY